MRNGIWLLLLIAAAVAGYVAGARGGEGPGTRAPRRKSPFAETLPPVQVQPADPAQADRAPEESAASATDERVAQHGGELPAAESRLAQPTSSAPVRGVESGSVTGEPGLDSGAAGVLLPGSPEEALLRDDLARGGPMGLLRGILRAGFEKRPWRTADRDGALAIAGDEETFASIFARRAAGPVVDGMTADWSALADGTTLEYPEGFFEIRWSAAPARFPRDLVLKGAGMDRTLLRIGTPRIRSDEVHGLTLGDLTLDCRRGALLRLDSGIAAVRLERCRVAKFDTMLVAAGAAIHMRECEVESGTLLRVERGLARLDECVVRGSVSADQGSHVACLFRHCSFVDAQPNLQATLESRRGVRLEECRFEVGTGAPQARPLSTINPLWKD